DKTSQSGILHNIGNIYTEQEKYPQAMENFKKAYALNTELNNKLWTGNNLSSMGRTLADMGNHAEAMKYLEKSSAIYTELGDKNGIASIRIDKAIVYIKMKQFETARKYIDTALTLSIEMSYLELIRDCYKTFAEIDSAESKWKPALENY